MKYAVLGGDRRAVAAAVELTRRGNDVRVWGCEYSDALSGVTFCRTWRLAASECECVVLPLPASNDGEYIRSYSEDGELLKFSQLISYLPEGATIVGGFIPDGFFDIAKNKNIKLYDYYESEELMIKNAQISAEGALMTAMVNTETSVCGCFAAVIGYGRIGRFLSGYLRALGAEVTVLARRAESLAWAESEGCKSEKINNGQISDGQLSRYDIIFNTVPARVIPRQSLGKLKSGAVIIELASKPGGFDPSDARELGVRAIWAPGLPGRYAPQSSGRAIASAISCLLEGGERE